MIDAYEDKKKQELQICLLSLLHGPHRDEGSNLQTDCLTCRTLWLIETVVTMNLRPSLSKPLFEKTIFMVTIHELPWVYQSIGGKLNICSLQTNQPLVVLDLQSLQSLD